MNRKGSELRKGAAGTEEKRPVVVCVEPGMVGGLIAFGYARLRAERHSAKPVRAQRNHDSEQRLRLGHLRLPRATRPCSLRRAVWPFSIALSGSLKPVSIAEPEMHLDAVSGQQKLVYSQPFSATLKLEPPFPQALWVKFQGCSNSACFFPEKHLFTVNSNGVLARSEKGNAESSDQDGRTVLTPISTNGFRFTGRLTGYVPKQQFLEFLEQSKSWPGCKPRCH